MQLVIIFAIAVAMNAIGTVLIKIGSAKLPAEFSIKIVADIVKNIHIIGGISLYLVSFPFYSYIFSKMNVNVAYPMFTSLAFAATILIAAVFLKENLTIIQIFGLLVIVGGIVLLTVNTAK